VKEIFKQKAKGNQDEDNSILLKNLSENLPVSGNKGYLPPGTHSKLERSESRFYQQKDDYTDADKEIL